MHLKETDQTLDTTRYLYTDAAVMFRYVVHAFCVVMGSHLYVFVCICIVCICICVHVYLCACVFVCMCICVHVYVLLGCTRCIGKIRYV